jgi:hypothetical protein
VTGSADRGAGKDRAVCECKDCGGQDRQQGETPVFARPASEALHQPLEDRV